MNAGQQMFHDFYMSLVSEGKEAAAEELLARGFQKQDEGGFDKAHLEASMSEYFALVRPEGIDQLKQAMARFAEKI